LTDSQIFFTGAFGGKFVINWLLNIYHHTLTASLATLPNILSSIFGIFDTTRHYLAKYRPKSVKSLMYGKDMNNEQVLLSRTWDSRTSTMTRSQASRTRTRTWCPRHGVYQYALCV